MRTSTQAANEVFGAQMRVSLEHLELFVPADRRDFSDVQALFKQATNSFMAKVVEVKIIHPCTNAEMFESEADRVTRRREHSLSVSALVSLQPFENRDRAT